MEFAGYLAQLFLGDRQLILRGDFLRHRQVIGGLCLLYVGDGDHADVEALLGLFQQVLVGLFFGLSDVEIVDGSEHFEIAVGGAHLQILLGGLVVRFCLRR